MQICARSIRVLVFFGLLAGPASSQTVAPNQISFQGVLDDGSGDPVPDGAYSMTFKLYTTSSGGSAIWTETRTSTDAVQVVDGGFNVNLGEISSLTGVDFDAPLFLGIAVESDPEMSPRTPLSSSPYALSMRNIYADGDEVIVSGPLGVAANPTRELTLNDTKGTGSSSMNFTATNRELVIGVNQSTGALIRGTTSNNLNLGAGNSDHLTVRSDGDIHVHENLLVGTSARRGLLTMRGPDDSQGGPILFMFGSSSDQVESGRIRFVEGTASTNWRGAFIHYDGSSAGNALHIGTHNTSDNNVANDQNAITISRSSADVTIEEDLNVVGDIEKDYGSGSFSSAAPFGFGAVDASGETLISSTASVLGISKKLDFWNVYLNSSCTSDSQTERFVPVVTVRELGVDDVSAVPDCASCLGGGNCARIIVKTNNAFGFQEVDFNFVVYDTE